MYYRTFSSLFILICITNVHAMPVEDFVTQRGTWQNLAQAIKQAQKQTVQIAQGVSLVESSYKNLQNFNLKDANNFAEYADNVKNAANLGMSVTANVKEVTKMTNEWTKSEANPEGRLANITVGMDTALATIATVEEESKIMEKSAGDISKIKESSKSVAGTTAAVQASNQLLGQMQEQTQALIRATNQGNILASTRYAQEQSRRKALEERRNELAEMLKDLDTNWDTADAPRPKLTAVKI